MPDLNPPSTAPTPPPPPPEVTPSGDDHRSTKVWLGLAERRLTERGTLRLRILWGRVAGLAMVLLLTGWLLLATIIFFFFTKYRGWEHVSYADALFIFARMDTIRASQGLYQIELAQEAFEQQRYTDAYRWISEGVSRAPEHVEGRLLWARMASSLDPELSLQILERGWGYASESVEYRNLYTQTLLTLRRDEALVELADAYLPPEATAEAPLSDGDYLLAWTAAQAAVHRGAYLKALDYFQRYRLAANLEGIQLASRLLQVLDKPAEAIRMLEFFDDNNPREAAMAPIYAALATLYAEEAQLDQAIDMALRHALVKPTEWQPRLALLHHLDTAGREQRIRNTVTDLIRRFGNNEQAMHQLGDFAASSGRIDLARRLYEQALTMGFDLGNFGLLLIETLIEADDYEEAQVYCQELVDEDPGWLERYSSGFSGMRAMTQYGLGNDDLGDLHLDAFIEDENTRIAQLLFIAGKLRGAGSLEPAQRLLAEAASRDPDNERVVSRLVELELEMGYSPNLASRIDTLLQLRRPSLGLLRTIYTQLNSDRFLFTPERDPLLTALSERLETTAQAAEQIDFVSLLVSSEEPAEQPAAEAG